MLADIFEQVTAERIINGALLYRLTADADIKQGEYTFLLNQVEQQKLGVLFCCDGTFRLRHNDGSGIEICGEEVLLLADFADVAEIEVTDSLVGYYLALDASAIDSVVKVYQMLGSTDWNYQEVEKFLYSNCGCLKLKHSNWKQSVFSLLKSLPESERGFYCMLKTAELVYLCYTWQSIYNDIPEQCVMSDYLVERLACVGTYIENHLDENLSITQLCSRFNLAPTTLKNRFREFYGHPIHNWIQTRRVRRAAEMLQSTNMTILQIAQSVGYESVSQFNVVFRRMYGITPSAYKKMSNTTNK